MNLCVSEIEYRPPESLLAARSIANFAVDEGVFQSDMTSRAVYHHLGAVLADSVLQAGLNYNSVVRPRVRAIFELFPHARSLGQIVEIVDSDESANFLQWRHPEKISRFENLVRYLNNEAIETTEELSEALSLEQFRTGLESIKGIGSKTIDYMGCLVGVECIAVDRHIRSFANHAGIFRDDYDFLKDTFCFAADLLSISRREFDGWVWHYQSGRTSQ